MNEAETRAEQLIDAIAALDEEAAEVLTGIRGML